MQYGEPVIRRAVPLALAILSASNPQLSIIDTLSKLSHDNDAEVSHNSIFAMGIVGAGKSHTIVVHNNYSSPKRHHIIFVNFDI